MHRFTNGSPRVGADDHAGHARPVVSDPCFRGVVDRVERYAKVDRAIIVLEGESGTGKNRLARHIHNSSLRASRPFREVSLAALDDGIAGSELFGHVQGAYTDARQQRAGHFASANRGTLFLDELGKASPAVQKKLLRIIETGECWPVGSDRVVPIDVRLIVATNTPLHDLVVRDQFLPDLYARLGSFRVRIPPLRERPADVAPLVRHFVRLHSAECGYHTPPRVHPDLMSNLERWSWPFNVREVESTVLRLLVDADGATTLGAELCVDDLEYLSASPRAAKPALSLETVQRAYAETGSISGAARSLGVHRATLYRQFPDVTARTLRPSPDGEANPN
jgi:two-component system response regulator HydG